MICKRAQWSAEAESEAKVEVEVEVEQGLTSHQTHYRPYGGRVLYGSKDPTNSVKALNEERS